MWKLHTFSKVDLVDVEGPIVIIHLYGAFWHKREAGKPRRGR